jgi:hypothetical protein
MYWATGNGSARSTENRIVCGATPRLLDCCRHSDERRYRETYRVVRGPVWSRRVCDMSGRARHRS